MRLLAAIFCLGVVCVAETKFGRPLALKEATGIDQLTSNPQKYVGKVVQVRGKVTEVCQMAGCWMMIADDSGNAIRIKVKDGEVVFPKDSPGKTAIAEGKFQEIKLTREQAVAEAKHEAEEKGRKFDEASVKGPKTTYQIQGLGAVLVD